jgi:hypothetical protein
MVFRPWEHPPTAILGSRLPSAAGVRFRRAPEASNLRFAEYRPRTGDALFIIGQAGPATHLGAIDRNRHRPIFSRETILAVA